MSENNLIDDYLRIVAAVRYHLEDQMELGVMELPAPKLPKPDDHRESVQAVAYNSMDDIRAAVERCRGCSLHESRKNIVFGEGSEETRLVFVGEAPGADEDQQGKPFVGRAGQKLSQIIKAMGLDRSDVYITNVLKCRPPGNRNPRPEEVKACEPFLIAQLQLIKPRVICALGTFAAHTLLRTDERISSLRGRFHTYHGIKLMPTYHPSYLLRNPDSKVKREVWEDVKKVKIEYDRQ